MHRTVLVLCAALGILASPLPLLADDWPQWRGEGRLGVWRENGIVETLPAELIVRWRTPIGSGYSGPAVAGGRVFITDWQEDPASRTLDGTERAVALDERSGEVLWTQGWPTSYRMLSIPYAIGPRATPTVDGDRVYVVGATGRFFCLDAASGGLLWEKDFVAEYDTSVPTWGITSAPLVDGDLVIAVVGGRPDALVVAFDSRTGGEIWRALPVAAEMGYTQPVIFEAGGARQLIIWHPTALAALDPATGDVYWQQPWEVGMGLTVATPVRSDDYLFVSQFFNGSMMVRLNGDRPDATLLWQGTSRSELPDQTDGLHALITTPVVDGDFIYGVGSYGELRSLDARTGERLWASPDMTPQARWGSAHIVQHDDRYFANTDDGFLVAARLTPAGYLELSRTPLIEPTSRSGAGTPHGRISDRPVNWPHPAYANRHIVQRNDREILRASLAAVDYR